MGHAIHGMLAADHSNFTFHASLPLAETASTFGEMLLVDRLLATKTNVGYVDMLFRQVAEAYATIMRQAYLAMFEREAHDLIDGGASVDDLAAAYRANLAQQFGDAVDVSSEFQWEWVSIPHIYQVPYRIAYAFGQLLVLALYQQYREEGASFRPRYLDLLAAGGSDAPARLLAQAGIDIYCRSFWQGGFDIIAGLVDDSEAMPLSSEM